MASTATLISWVRDAIGVDSSGYVTDAMILNWLNIAQRSLCTQGGIQYTTETATTVAGQEEYSVPGDYLKVMAVYIYHTTGDKAQRALFPITVVERDPTLAQGTPEAFFIHGANVISDNSMVIGLRPIPDANNAGANLEIWIRQLPKDMVSGGQGPESMLQWQDCLVHFAAARAFTRLSTADPGKAALADREMAIWETWMKRARKFQSPMALGIPTRRILTYTPGHDFD
jgi:hypothetical protein